MREQDKTAVEVTQEYMDNAKRYLRKQMPVGLIEDVAGAIECCG